MRTRHRLGRASTSAGVFHASADRSTLSHCTLAGRRIHRVIHQHHRRGLCEYSSCSGYQHPPEAGQLMTRHENRALFFLQRFRTVKIGDKTVKLQIVSIISHVPGAVRCAAGTARHCVGSAMFRAVEADPRLPPLATPCSGTQPARKGSGQSPAHTTGEQTASSWFTM